jgi:putative transposase
VVKILLYAVILSRLVRRYLLDLITAQAADAILFQPERWTATIRSPASP